MYVKDFNQTLDRHNATGTILTPSKRAAGGCEGWDEYKVDGEELDSILHLPSLHILIISSALTSTNAKMGSIAVEQTHTVKPSFPAEANSLEYAQSLDAKDHLRSFREKFVIPSKENIKSKKLSKPGQLSTPPRESCDRCY